MNLLNIILSDINLDEGEMLVLQVYMGYSGSLLSPKGIFNDVQAVRFDADVVLKHYPELKRKKRYISTKLKSLVAKNILNSPSKGYYSAGMKYGYVTGEDRIVTSIQEVKPLELEKKKKAFELKIKKYLKSDGNNTGLVGDNKKHRDILNNFYEYWTEVLVNKPNKLRWEDEKAFDIGRRIKTCFPYKEYKANEYKPGLK